MSHGKVIKNRSFGAGALIKSVYDISLFVLASLWLFLIFAPPPLVSGSSLKRCQKHVLVETCLHRPDGWTAVASVTEAHARLSPAFKRHLNGAKRSDIFLTRTGAIAVSPFKRRQHSIQRTIYLLCCHAPPPHTHIEKKNAVYKIFSYSQGALSRLLEASALIA